MLAQFERLKRGAHVAPGDRPGKDHFDFLHTALPFRHDLLDLTNAYVMDEKGIDVHVFSLTIPGVQMHKAEDVAALARETNDAQAAIISRYPGRFAGLAAVAPQMPEAAARETVRLLTDLKLNGVIIDPHTHGKYFGERKFAPVLPAAEAYDAAIYPYPQLPSRAMIDPMERYAIARRRWLHGDRK